MHIDIKNAAYISTLFLAARPSQQLVELYIDKVESKKFSTLQLFASPSHFALITD